MKHCAICGKIIWPYQIRIGEVIFTNKVDGEKVYHKKCYWNNKFKDGNDSSFNIK